jgi:O-acetyl-ADP-ribose deacetylase
VLLPLPGGRRIELAVGNITLEATDAIVNAANSALMGGGGVDGAIHRAGGPAILEECKNVRARRGMLPPGQAVATTGGKLAARYVIHTVGPIWSGGSDGEPETLASCYREALRVGEELGLASVAFPSISTGAFGYPVQQAARVALPAVKLALQTSQAVLLVRFVLFDQATFMAYAEALESLGAGS